MIRTSRVLALLAALLCLSGCFEWGTPAQVEQKELVTDFFTDWYAGQVGRQAWASMTGTRDEEAEAVMEASAVLINLHQADKLMDQGRREEDPAKMDAAIAARPADWTYRISRASLALQQGDLKTYSAQMEDAEFIILERGIDHDWVARKKVADLEYVESRIRVSGTSVSACQQIYHDLELQYVYLAERTGEDGYRTRAKWALERQESCWD